MRTRNTQVIKRESREEPKVYHSFYEFKHDYPLPKKTDSKKKIEDFYWALLHINSAYFPEAQSRLRSNLLVEIGTYAGIIKPNLLARL